MVEVKCWLLLEMFVSSGQIAGFRAHYIPFYQGDTGGCMTSSVTKVAERLSTGGDKKGKGFAIYGSHRESDAEGDVVFESAEG